MNPRPSGNEPDELPDCYHSAILALMVGLEPTTSRFQIAAKLYGCSAFYSAFIQIYSTDSIHEVLNTTCSDHFASSWLFTHLPLLPTCPTLPRLTVFIALATCYRFLFFRFSSVIRNQCFLNASCRSLVNIIGVSICTTSLSN